MNTKIWLEIMKRERSEDKGVDESMLLKWILQK